MSNHHPKLLRVLTACFSLLLVGIFLTVATPKANALILSSSGDVNVTATVLGIPPSTPAIIQSPLDGAILITTPLVVRGSCGPALTVRVFNHGQLAGTITCDSIGQFVMNITLDIGTNVLTALNYDAQDQPGPASLAITITVVPPTKEEVGQQILATDKAGSSSLIESLQGVIGDDSLDTNDTGVQDPQRLFEGTLAEPVAKLLDIGTTASPSANSAISVALNGLFVIGLIGVFVILLL